MKFFEFLFLICFCLALTVQAAFATQGVPAYPLPLIVEQRMNSSALSSPIVHLGTQVTQKKVNVLKAVYDFAILGGASGSSIILKDSDAGMATLPKNALVKSVVAKVVTPLAVSQANTTVQCGWDSTASNLLGSGNAVALNTSNGFTAGAIVQGTVTGWRRVDDGYNVAVGCKLGGPGALTAGKMVLYIEYYIGAPNEP